MGYNHQNNNGGYSSGGSYNNNNDNNGSFNGSNGNGGNGGNGNGDDEKKDKNSWIYLDDEEDEDEDEEEEDDESITHDSEPSKSSLNPHASSFLETIEEESDPVLGTTHSDQRYNELHKLFAALSQSTEKEQIYLIERMIVETIKNKHTQQITPKTSKKRKKKQKSNIPFMYEPVATKRGKGNFLISK